VPPLRADISSARKGANNSRPPKADTSKVTWQKWSTLMAMFKTGDRVNALYLSREHGTCLVMNRNVLAVTQASGGRHTLTVDLPDDAVYPDGTYTVTAAGCSDYIDRYHPQEAR
jgi:hypothetical protein